MESIRLCIAAIVALGLLEIHPLAEAGEADAAGSKTENNIADANNPLAKTSAFNLQNQFTGNLSVIDEPANSLLFRAAVPVSAFDSTVLFRATLPVNTFPDGRGAGHETGLGDFNIFAAYLIDTGDPTLSFGIGPQITVPTATDDALGSGKWSAGFANVLFSAADPVFQWGYLLTWQASFAGEGGGRNDVNTGAFQPFLFYQLGGGTYLRSTGVMTYDFENDAWAVPFGLGIGHVVKVERGVLNIFIEPQYYVLTHGAGQPEWGVFGGINFQF